MIQVYECDNLMWDSVVQSFANHEAYQLRGYSTAFQMLGDGEPVLLSYERNGVRGIDVMMRREIPYKKGFYDYTTPYGYGGWIFEGELSKASLESFNVEYRDFCLQNKIVCAFVRFNPVQKNAENGEAIFNLTRLGATIAMTLDQGSIWENIHSKNRNMIRKAQKNGITIQSCAMGECIDEFMRMYNATMDKDNALAYYYFPRKFYESIDRLLFAHHRVFFAELNGKKVAMAIILFAGKHAHYHLSTTDAEFMSLAPMNLLLFEVANWASEQGYHLFHLGGGVGGQEDSLYKFKSTFNKKSEFSFFIGKQIFDNDAYASIIDMVEQENGFDATSNFFPQYRQVRK